MNEAVGNATSHFVANAYGCFFRVGVGSVLYLPGTLRAYLWSFLLKISYDCIAC